MHDGIVILNPSTFIQAPIRSAVVTCCQVESNSDRISPSACHAVMEHAQSDSCQQLTRNSIPPKSLGGLGVAQHSEIDLHNLRHPKGFFCYQGADVLFMQTLSVTKSKKVQCIWNLLKNYWKKYTPKS